MDCYNYITELLERAKGWHLRREERGLSRPCEV